MEKHHKLRRPQGSSIHGCNICGKEGHQAAVCPNGTSNNWPEKFGPLWTVDLDAVAAKQREPDYKAIAERARAFVAERLAAEEAGESAAEGAGGRENADGEGAGTGTGTGRGRGTGTGAPRPPVSDWRVYYDPMGRPYYHNGVTGQTQWTPPATGS